MHGYDLILTITGGLTAALILGYLTQRLGLSPIVGYLLAGTLVGPHTPGFVAHGELAEQLAEIGVILLMFGVGLQFHVEELLAVRRVAIPGAIAQSGAVGWEWSGALIFGMALAVASTVVLIRILSDNNDLHTPAGHIAVGWLVVEDLFTVIALVLLPALFGPATTGSPLWAALGLTVLKVAALVAFTALVGTRVIPRILDYVAHTRSRELFTLTVLVIALGIAVGSSLIFSVSMALGAFLAGMVVGRSDYSLRRAVLRVGRHAARSTGAPRFTGPRARLARDRADRKAARGGAGGLDHGISVQSGGDVRHRLGPDRGVLLHPRVDGTRARRAAGRSDECARRHSHRVHRGEPDGVPDHRADRTMGARAPGALGSRESFVTRARRSRGLTPGPLERAEPSRGRDRVRSDGPDAGAAAPG
jgi:hypothetical protein